MSDTDRKPGRKASRSSSARSLIRGAAHAACEFLEARQLFSSSITVVGGDLILSADSTTSSRMIVSLSRDGSTIDASINGKHQHFSRDSVKSVQMTGSNHNDRMRISSRLHISSTMLGGGGNDTIWGGGGNDQIDGGSGNDRVNGRRGNDVILSGAGRNTLLGGAGDDTIDGTEGSDTIDGQTGKNRIIRTSADKVRKRRRDTIIAGTPSEISGAPGDGSTSGTNSQTSSGLSPVIQFIESSGMAGHVVHVNALASALGAGDALNTRFNWDFGDAGSRFNTLTGWNTAHQYSKPGTYTVTLTLTDAAGNRAKTTAMV